MGASEGPVGAGMSLNLNFQKGKGVTLGWPIPLCYLEEQFLAIFKE